jgi:hypothetical protein
MAQTDYCDTLLYVHKTTNLGDAMITERYVAWLADRRERLSDRRE